MINIFACTCSITSVCLIYYVESAADSKKSLGGMKILNMVSKNFTCPPIILKMFRPEISMVVEISTDFDLLSIIEFQIYSFILPILQANLGKILAKMLSNCVICIKSHLTPKYCITNYDIERKTQTLPCAPFMAPQKLGLIGDVGYQAPRIRTSITCSVW